MRKKATDIPRTTVTIRMDVELLRKVDSIAYKNGGDRSKFIEQAVRYYLEHIDEARKPEDSGEEPEGEEEEESLEELEEEELEEEEAVAPA